MLAIGEILSRALGWVSSAQTLYPGDHCYATGRISGKERITCCCLLLLHADDIAVNAVVIVAVNVVLLAVCRTFPYGIVSGMVIITGFMKPSICTVVLRR